MKASTNFLTASASGRSTKRRAAAAVVAAMAIAGAGAAVSTDTIGAQTVAVTEDEAEIFVALDPERVLDTRSGIGADAGQLDAGETINVTFAGVAGVPDTATSVAINTTIPASSTSDEGFFTVWPAGEARPPTSANNSNPGQPVPNFSLFQLGDDGALSVYLDDGQADFVIDVVGYFLPLSEVEAGTVIGGDLLSGEGPPAATLGDDGDAYVDTLTGQLYVKANGVFVPTGTPTVVTDSAIGARNDGSAAGVDPAVDDDSLDAADFNTTDAEFGTAIDKTDIDTFTLVEAGFYEVTYRLSSELGALTFGAQLEVDGAPVGNRNILAAGGGQLTDTVLVEAAAGDTLELDVDDIAQLSDDRSITVELLAVT